MALLGRHEPAASHTDAPFKVIQLSDTHFIEDGRELEGGLGYNTDDAFAAVAERLDQSEPPDLIVVTGDVADYGTPADYAKAADALASLGAPVNACPGNHDQDLPFTVGMARSTVSTSRAVRMGTWLFLFADSNQGHMKSDEFGRLVDPPDYADRLHQNGRLGRREQAWLVDACRATDADHVFVWVHHPPMGNMPLTKDLVYDDEWLQILPEMPKLRGVGAGHTHTPGRYTVEDADELPVFVAPAFKSNYDLENETILPPGYRSYEFLADGTVTSEAHFVGEDRWPRKPLSERAMSVFRGEITFEQYRELESADSA
jgi:Icc protein